MIVSYCEQGYVFTPESIEEVKALNNIINALVGIKSFDQRPVEDTEITALHEYNKEFYGIGTPGESS